MITKKTVYLVRHGETAWNNEGRIQGTQDLPLNDKGLFQARCAALRLEQIPCAQVYSSPMQRALQTAQQIAGDKRKIIILDELIEQDYGAWSGKTLAYILKNFPKEFVAWRHNKLGYELPDGEPKAHILQRANIVAQKLLSAQDSTLIVVTHGAFSRSLLTVMLGEKYQQMLWNYNLGNCAITKLQIDETGNATLVYINDTLHTKIAAQDDAQLREQISKLELA